MAKGETYEKFVEKFKPAKTTDDCYTPNSVYNAVKSWAVSHYAWGGRPIVRPFYPGGDYINFDYPADCVVIDNPPFSILAQIVAFYAKRGIDYFLFAPGLTLLSATEAASRIAVGVSVTYANGAEVSTSFLCSQGPTIMSSPELYRVVNEANRGTISAHKVAKPKYEYPANVMTSSKLNKFSKSGVDYEASNVVFTRALDQQREKGKSIYGGAFIVPSEPAKQALERLKQALDQVQVWELSPREEALLEDVCERRLNHEQMD